MIDFFIFSPQCTAVFRNVFGLFLIPVMYLACFFIALIDLAWRFPERIRPGFFQVSVVPLFGYFLQTIILKHIVCQLLKLFKNLHNDLFLLNY